jgi:hypothetical protein
VAFTDAGPVGELLGVGDPLDVLDELLGDGDGLGDGVLLGVGEWAGLLLADLVGAAELVRQLGEACGDALCPAVLDPVPLPGCGLWCADPGVLPPEP